MTGLTIYMSNRTELLAEQLAGVLRVSQNSPLSPEIIVVQSTGMQRWLSLRLAEHNGICANVQFPFPKAFLTAMTARLVPDLDRAIFETHSDPALMTFKLMRILPQHLHFDDFKRLMNYLTDDPQGLKRFQLCQRIAFLFDQYMVYRPDFLQRWETERAENDSDCRWQSQLWRHLNQESASEQRTRWPQALAAAVSQKSPAADLLPARASIFGVSYLPPLYLQLLTDLSRLMHLNLFWLNPSREYWGDIVSERQAHRLRRKADPTDDDLYLESGNRLLAAFGSLGRNFMQMLMDCNSQTYEQYEEPTGNTLLTDLQKDILDLREQAAENMDADRHIAASAEAQRCLDDPDPSIQVHSCHSPLREMEVLHDNLLAFLEMSPDLKPGDIIVMAPDIETYAPYIQAVFGTQTDPGTSVPYSISDRSARRTSGIIDGFMALLDLRDSRLGASEMVRMLEYPGVMERFGLGPPDLPKIEQWVRESQIRWGADSGSREMAGLPAFKENTWSEGFRRILLGYAMPSDEKVLFKGILPYDHIEGGDTVALGNFIDFVTRLFGLQARLKDPLPISRWQAILADILTQFFLVEPDRHREIQLIRQTIARLAESAVEARFEEAVDLAVVQRWLSELLQTTGGEGFLGQGVTFCALLPMRSIPFKVVCLIGMDNAAFPRDSQPMDFDLIARNPRAGDRSRRDDDRYLFLEAILSARKILYISYVGQNIHDNSPIPPSVLVRELLDTLDSADTGREGLLSDRIAVKHRLQPFAAQYFKDDRRLFSYSTENMAVSTRRKEPQSQEPFYSSPLALTETENLAWRQLDLEGLAQFWRNPCRFLLRRRLGIYLETDDRLLTNCERFQLEGLDRYRLGEQLLRQRLDQSTPPDPYALVAASGRLPPANSGRLAYDEMAGEVNALVAGLSSGPIESNPIRLQVDYRHGDMRLMGAVPQARQSGCLNVRFANTKARDLLQTWIYHLGYAIAAAPDEPISHLFCRDNSWRFGPLADSAVILSELLDLFSTGLTVPLAFAPQSAFAYADALLRRDKSESAALISARRVWEGNEWATGEAEDPYLNLCFREKDLLSEEFKALAVRVFGPLFIHLQPVQPETAAL